MYKNEEMVLKNEEIGNEETGGDCSLIKAVVIKMKLSVRRLRLPLGRFCIYVLYKS